MLMVLLVAAAMPGCRRAGQGSPPAPRNLLLVTIDTLRADHVGAYGAAAATPALDRVAREGTRFAAAWSPVPLTLPAHATILTGLLPPRHGLRLNGAGALPQTTRTLAGHLRDHGYRTAAFVAAFVLDRRFGLGREFDHFDDEIPAAARHAGGLEAERPGTEVVARALAWLGAADTRPFFAWVHLYEPHAPYEPPEPYRSTFPGDPYRGEVATADAAFDRLLRYLDEAGLAHRTLLAVMGDHGEALGEHGELTHGLLLYEPSLAVPLLMRLPATLPAGWVVETPVSLADVAPTLAEGLGHPLPGEIPFDGRTLWSDLTARRQPAAADLYAESRYPATFGWSPLAAIRRGSMKYILAPEAELFDLAKDPGETRNLVTANPSLVTALLPRLAELASGGSSASPLLDAEARARLASLGYITGGEVAPSGRQARDPKAMVALFREFEQAHWALVAGRWQEARTTLERLVAADPANPVFVGQLAEAARRGGDLDRALQYYRQALSLNPDDREARYNYAVTLQEAGRLEEAFVALKTAISLDPGRPEAHNALGIALAARGELPLARDEFRRAVELDPRNTRAWNNLGNVLRDLGNLDEAEQAYRRAVFLDASYVDPWNGLGTVEVQRDRPLAALPYFDRALALAPSLHEARMNRAIALDLAGRGAEAMREYRAFLAAAGGDRRYAPQREAARQLLARLEAGSRGSRALPGKEAEGQLAPHVPQEE